MKKIKAKLVLCVAIFLVAGITSSAQSWNLLQEGKQWNHAYKYWSSDIEKYVIRHTTAIKFINDTLINDSLYKKAYYSQDEEYTNWSLTGFVREDDEGFYFRNLTNNEEKLYSYNLQIGDVFYSKNSLYSSDSLLVSVNDIDSILINGIYKKRYRLIGPWQYDNGMEDWIEGIGSLSGIIYPFINEMTTGGEVRLLCYFEDGQPLYKTSIFGLSECYYEDYVLANNEIEYKQIAIYPNPAKDIINIESDITSDLNYCIYDVSGRVYLTGQLADNRINVSGFRKGVYILRLSQQSGIIIRKIVKE